MGAVFSPDGRTYNQYHRAIRSGHFDWLEVGRIEELTGNHPVDPGGTAIVVGYDCIIDLDVVNF